MTSTVRLLAAAALLGVLTGCANWNPSMPAGSVSDPPLYESSPSN
ncbi:MAG: hypothetical protein JWM26_3692 [Betaproteobacteria bacterium]|jgi:hypothetical protein|nr:hypothetical protein [Betaproteobacteria bacterium]